MNILQRVAGSERAIEIEMSEDGPSWRGLINRGKTATEGRQRQRDFEASRGIHKMLFSIALRNISHLFEHSVGRVTRRDASSCTSSGWRIAQTHVTAPAGTPGILKHIIIKK